MKVAIIGASGFVGRTLTHHLLDTTDHELVLFSHKATKLHFAAAEERRIMHIDGSVLQYHDIRIALQDCTYAVYLVHLMGTSHGSGDFATQEQQAATNFTRAVNHNHIGRVVYVGGMGDPDSQLTKHLRSRDATGTIIRSMVPQLIELKTPMIIGTGGAGFEVLKSLVTKSPVFPVPRWARAVTQPITVQDVARYAALSLTLAIDGHQTVVIGGPERLSYVQIAKRYAAFAGTRLRVLPLPFAPRWLARLVLRSFGRTAYAVTVADMIDSAGYSTVVNDDMARRLFPDIVPEAIDRAFTA